MSRNNESFASIRYTFVFDVKFEEKEKLNIYDYDGVQP